MRLHRLSIHIFGLLFMFVSAAVVVLFFHSLRDLWHLADDFGKGLMVGAGLVVFVRIASRGLRG